MNLNRAIIAALSFSGQVEPEVTRKYMNYWDEFQHDISPYTSW